MRNMVKELRLKHFHDYELLEQKFEKAEVSLGAIMHFHQSYLVQSDGI